MEPEPVQEEVQETLQELHAQLVEAERNTAAFELEGFESGSEEALDVFTGMICRQLVTSAKIIFFKEGIPPKAEYLFFNESTLTFIEAFRYPLIKEMQRCLQEMWKYGGVMVHERDIAPGTTAKGCPNKGVVARFTIRIS